MYRHIFIPHLFEFISQVKAQLQPIQFEQPALVEPELNEFQKVAKDVIDPEIPSVLESDVPTGELLFNDDEIGAVAMYVEIYQGKNI